MTIDELMGKIMPPDDYSHRNGFSNIALIDGLSEDEKVLVESRLIEMVPEMKGVDNLIVESLDYLKSEKSLPVLYQKLGTLSLGMEKLIVASSIFMINSDVDMIEVAISSFKKMDNRLSPYYTYNLTSGFYYLSKFSTLETNNLIKNYRDHQDYLVSYNSKRYYNQSLS